MLSSKLSTLSTFSTCGLVDSSCENKLFSFKSGFDPLRSLILYAKDRGLIEGNKNRMKFKDDPDCVFSLKNIMKEKDEKPIWENLKKYVIPKLNDHLSYIEPSETKFDDRTLDY